MKLTERDIKMFAQLAETDSGKQLVEYLNRLMSEVCDSRNWAEGEDKAHANKVAKVIEESLINKLILQNSPSKQAPYPYQ